MRMVTSLDNKKIMDASELTKSKSNQILQQTILQAPPKEKRSQPQCMPFEIAKSSHEDNQSNFFLDNPELFANISQVAGNLKDLPQKDSESFVSIMNYLQAKSTSNQTNKGLSIGKPHGIVKTSSSSSNNTAVVTTQKSSSLVFGGECDLLSMS